MGEVQGSLFAADGHTVDMRLWRHTLGVAPTQIARVPRVLAAVADERKAQAVRSVCCSGILTDLVVDVELAVRLLSMPQVRSVRHRLRGDDPPGPGRALPISYCSFEHNGASWPGPRSMAA
ncbi:hypothetical protein G7085_20560 [Tessaracoccus sp. HDW20]|nr:hypothetical protein [Tessaracoccus coleopterorum]